MEKEFKRAIILTVALILAAISAFIAAVASTGAFTRLSLTLAVESTETLIYLQPGEAPDMGAIAVPVGTRILCWTDESGNEADPSAPVREDSAYKAVLGPAFSETYEPWLETDGNGLANPDLPITGDELAAGIEAMFAAPVDVSAISGAATVTADELASVLEGLFTYEELEEIGGGGALTRIEAAQVLYPLYMNAVYGSDWGFDALYSVPTSDLDPLRPGADCLAACLILEDTRLYGEGFHNIGGWLYCADETGLFYMDTELGGFTFGQDGRYTSGSRTLDALVAEVLEPICERYDSRSERLRAAYLYVRDNFDYLRRNYYEVGDEGWEIDEAVTMLETHRGNCYNYAAAFWALARGLGYDATAVAGTVGWARSPHGWVIMYDTEGTRVIYDVELEMAYHYDRGRTDTDLYELYPDAAYSWNYVYGEQYE